MTLLLVTDLKGEEKAIDVPSGTKLMEAIRDAGFGDLLATCGGSCSCATCQVYVDPAFAHRLPEMTIDESELLDGSDYRKPESRLSCQITFDERLAGLRVTIAPAD